MVSCPGILEVLCYGDPNRSFLIGIVVADPKYIKNIADVNYLSKSKSIIGDHN